MDYGDSAAPNPSVYGMGQYAIDSAVATRAQAVSVGLGYSKVGLIPMIGINDVMSEVSNVNRNESWG